MRLAGVRRRDGIYGESDGFPFFGNESGSAVERADDRPEDCRIESVGNSTGYRTDDGVVMGVAKRPRSSETFQLCVSHR